MFFMNKEISPQNFEPHENYHSYCIYHWATTCREYNILWIFRLSKIFILEIIRLHNSTTAYYLLILKNLFMKYSVQRKFWQSSKINSLKNKFLYGMQFRYSSYVPDGAKFSVNLVDQKEIGEKNTYIVMQWQSIKVILLESAGP